MQKPNNMIEYRKWYEKHLDGKIDQSKKNYFDLVINTMHNQILNSDFWSSFDEELNNVFGKYLLDTKYEFMSQPIKQPDLFKKSFASFEDKLYRKNVVNNSNWPNPPEGGWYFIDDSFERINDLIRTSYVVKYLDGVEILAERIKDYTEKLGLSCIISYEAREQGYYAAHLEIEYEFEIPSINWDTRKFFGSFEIQITTQLQEVLKKLTHAYYEDRRIRIEKEQPEKKWQWNYKSEEFTVNYLGHILHYLEGMILEVRDRRKNNV